MTPAQLRSFLAVARSGSVRAAAAELVVTQPAVSAAVAALGRELGTPLFRRDGRGVALTPAGEVLAGYAARILGLWDEAGRASRAAADPSRGTLRLAAVTTAGEQVVPALLVSFRRRHPAVEIVLEVGNRRRVWELLAAHEADLAVGGRPPAGSELISVARSPHELVVVAAPSGPARRRPRAVGLEDMASRAWLVREAGSGTRSTTEELLAELGIEPTRLTLGSNGAIREAVAAGLGVALISRAAVARDLADGWLEEWVAGPLPLRRWWHLVVRRSGGLSPTAALFFRHAGRRGSGWTIDGEVPA
jgi:DNA-binding transcriptional LysR family regulator